MKKIVLIVLIAALAFVFFGCANTDTDTAAETADTEEDSPFSTLAPFDFEIAGSLSMTPIMNALVDMYTEKNPELNLIVRDRGDGAALAYSSKGTYHIVMLSRELKEAELSIYSDVESTLLCQDGIAIVAGADCPVRDLSAEQVKKIFLGEITDWSEIGGEQGEISPYVLDTAMGISEVFEALLLGTDEDGNLIEIDKEICSVVDTHKEMAETIAGDNMGIGFMSLGATMEHDLTVFDIDSIAATASNIKSGEYIYHTNYSLVTIGDIKDNVSEFITYCTNNADAIAYIEEAGYVIP